MWPRFSTTGNKGDAGGGTLRLLVAPALSGAMIASAFPGIGTFQAGVWLGLLPLLAALWWPESRPLSGRRAFLAGWVAGFVFFLITLRWLRDIYSAGPWLSPLAWGALSAYLGCYFGLWAAFASGPGRPRKRHLLAEKGIFASSGHGLRLALLNASAWVALEWVRGWMLTGFPWNGLGTGYQEALPMVQIAEIVGTPGLAFLPVFCSTILLFSGWRLTHHLRHGGLRRPLNLDATIALALVGGVFLFGMTSIARHAPDPVRDTRIEVAIIQGNIAQEDKWDPQQAEAHARNMVDNFREALEKRDGEIAATLLGRLTGDDEDCGLIELRPPDLVVLPESALPFFLHDPTTRETIEALHLLAGPRSTVVTGINDLEPGDPPNYFNTIAAFGPPPAPPQIYRKVTLVPFGEYLPLRWFPPMRWIAGSAVPSDFTPGTSTDPLPISRGEEAPIYIIPLICFEDTIARLARRFSRPDQPQVIVNATNDGWFADPAAALQHAANARFRAIELRRPMVRAANTGLSVACDAAGSFIHPVDGTPQRLVHPETGSHQVRGTLFATVFANPDSTLTFYARYGDIFSVLCLVITLIAVWLFQSHAARHESERRSTKTRRHPPESQ